MRKRIAEKIICIKCGNMNVEIENNLDANEPYFLIKCDICGHKLKRQLDKKYVGNDIILARKDLINIYRKQANYHGVGCKKCGSKNVIYKSGGVGSGFNDGDYFYCSKCLAIENKHYKSIEKGD